MELTTGRRVNADPECINYQPVVHILSTSYQHEVIHKQAGVFVSAPKQYTIPGLDVKEKIRCQLRIMRQMIKVPQIAEFKGGKPVRFDAFFQIKEWKVALFHFVPFV